MCFVCLKYTLNVNLYGVILTFPLTFLQLVELPIAACRISAARVSITLAHQPPHKTQVQRQNYFKNFKTVVEEH